MKRSLEDVLLYVDGGKPYSEGKLKLDANSNVVSPEAKYKKKRKEQEEERLMRAMMYAAPKK